MAYCRSLSLILILDLLICRSDSSAFLSNIYPDFPALSDHDAVLATLSIPSKGRPSRITKIIRPIRKIDTVNLSNDIISSTLYTSPPDNLSDYVNEFNTVLLTLLDKHAPFRSVTCSTRPDKPYFTPDIRAAKTKRSRLETIFRRSRTPENLANLKNQSKVVSKLLTSARRDYFHRLVSTSSKQPKKLWNTLNTLLSRSSDKKLPCSLPMPDLPMAFLRFFTDKLPDFTRPFQLNPCLLTFHLQNLHLL